MRNLPAELKAKVLKTCDAVAKYTMADKNMHDGATSEDFYGAVLASQFNIVPQDLSSLTNKKLYEILCKYQNNTKREVKRDIKFLYDTFKINADLNLYYQNALQQDEEDDRFEEVATEFVNQNYQDLFHMDDTLDPNTIENIDDFSQDERNDMFWDSFENVNRKCDKIVKKY